MRKKLSVYYVLLCCLQFIFCCICVPPVLASESALQASVNQRSEDLESLVKEKNETLPPVKSVASSKKNLPTISMLDDVPPNKLKSIVQTGEETNRALRIVLGLTMLAVLPAILVSMTAFLRIIIVLSMLRHAIGMQETPPNSAMIGLALFLTLFIMAPTFQTINVQAFQPFMSGKMNVDVAYQKTCIPIREFMVRQTREQDLALMVELSKSKLPESIDDIGNLQLIPAFMLSELRAAFQIGFIIFLPFLLIDLVVSSILMALGMMMMPPVSIALPLKILMFILIDGWSLVLKALVGSFH